MSHYYFNDADAAKQAAVEAMFNTSTHAAVATALASQNATVLRATADTLNEAVNAVLAVGADSSSVAYSDQRSAAFMRQGEASRLVEIRTAASDELTWRLQGYCDFLTHYRTCIKRVTVTSQAPKATDSIPIVRVASMPERVKVQDVERDAYNEITRTVTLEKDAT